MADPESTRAHVRPGEPVRMSFTKYDGTQHWWGDLTALGSDRYGVWLGGAPDTPWSRPGRVMLAGAHWVNLVPHEGRYVATFNAPGGTLTAQVYVDVTDVPLWSRDAVGGALRVDAVDLDLDVVRRFGGACSIDDEDEFEAHRASYGYPHEMVQVTRAQAEALLREMTAGAEPYGRVGAGWLAAWQAGSTC